MDFKILPSFLLEDYKYLLGEEDLILYKHPIGTGPYKFVSQEGPASEIVLEINEQYHLGTPSIRRVIMKPFADQNIITQTLLYGGIDLEVRVPPRDIGEIQGDSRFELNPYSTVPAGIAMEGGAGRLFCARGKPRQVWPSGRAFCGRAKGARRRFLPSG